MGKKSKQADPQGEIVAFLADPASHPGHPASVEMVETHGARVFLAGGEVYKIKRAVRYPYMDFSTLARRRAACLNEIKVNKETAPSIYRGVVAITREADGTLAIGGAGKPVEWAVHMRRFDEDKALDRLAVQGRLGGDLCGRLAVTVAAMHGRAQAYRDIGWLDAVTLILAQNREEFARHQALFPPAEQGALAGAEDAALERLAPLLAARERDGFVRHCHGDLHLRNIVLIDGDPVPFDAIEFDDAMARIDTLYDLAFLLTDLELRNLRPCANIVLNRYLTASGEAQIEGLAALPLYLACRAAIRAKVAASLLDLKAGEPGGRAETERYFAAARAFLAPPPPRLVAVGGLSGTGKTTLARALSPTFGAAPGALHLRSDVERKRMLGRPETERLGEEHYSRAVTARVYDRLMQQAAGALAAGHSVIVDAVFADPAERQAAADMAQATGVTFCGLWLSAPEATMISRVETRHGDASDATASVVAAQLSRPCGPIDWKEIPAGGAIDETVNAAKAALAQTFCP